VTRLRYDEILINDYYIANLMLSACASERVKNVKNIKICNKIKFKNNEITYKLT